MTGSSVRGHAARIGSAPFLFPDAVMRPFKGCAPSMTNVSISASATAVDGISVAIVLTRGDDTSTGLGHAEQVQTKRGPAPACPWGPGLRCGLRAQVRRRRRALARNCATARL